MLSSDEYGYRQPRPKSHISKLSITLAIFCLIAVGSGGYFYMQYQAINNEKTANARIVAQIAKSVQLPDESPVFIMVVDKDKLTNKQLATKVNNGDIMLIFARAKRLVVYRPSIAKVADILGFSDEQELPR